MARRACGSDIFLQLIFEFLGPKKTNQCSEEFLGRLAICSTGFRLESVHFFLIFDFF